MTWKEYCRANRESQAKNVRSKQGTCDRKQKNNSSVSGFSWGQHEVKTIKPSQLAKLCFWVLNGVEHFLNLTPSWDFFYSDSEAETNKM